MPRVLITGAVRGIGFEFARQYAADGWSVIATVRDARAGAKLAALGANVAVHIADVADPRTLFRLARDIKGAPVDLLICNAGILGPEGQKLGSSDYEAWAETYRVNVIGAWASVEALADNVAASAQKRVVLISSGAGSVSADLKAMVQSRQTWAYRASKAALNSAMRSLAFLLAERGVTVISLSPGGVRTDMGPPSAPLSPEESVTGMRRVIAGLTPAQNGAFLRYNGEAMPW